MLQQSSQHRGHILIAEDDVDIRELIVAQLCHELYELEAVGTAAEVTQAVARGAVDLLVLDLCLPDADGLDLCRQLRGAGYTGAVIMVTARDTPFDRVLGLELGADDYLTKPFEPRELLIRIRNLLKRSHATPDAPGRNASIASFGPWRLDLHRRRLIAADDRLVMLSGAEYRLLRRFLDAPNKVLARDDLLPERSATVAFDRSSDLHVSRLRQKLAAEPGGANLILTVRNEGYVLAAPVVFA